jgi:two-component system phosphate regulon response regulator OmpR
LHGVLPFVRAPVRAFDRNGTEEEVAMKPTAMSNKCLSGARGLSHAGVERGARSAHTPQRFPTSPASAHRLALGEQHPGYVEAPAAPASKAARPLPDAKATRRVLHVDNDSDGAGVLAGLLAPEAEVIHAATLADAIALLENNIFSLVVLDPALPDGDARVLLPLLAHTPLLVYSAHQPEWRTPTQFLPKPWTSPRDLWSAVATLLGISASAAAQG